MATQMRMVYRFWLILGLIGTAGAQGVLAGDAKPIRRADSLPSTTPWNLAALSKCPEFTWGEGRKVRSLYYRGEPYKGKATRVFAYYATPGTLSGEPARDKNLPAIVLVHGGGGAAFANWAQLWAKRGYAAIAMDLAGRGPKGVRLADGGPGQGHDIKFGAIDQPITEQWTYHAVANVIRAHSLILSFPEVDAERTALTGISWGGYLTCIVAGLDNRFKAAVPVYGCGFLHENSAWLGDFAKMSADNRAKWIRLWDPCRYVGSAEMPMLFLNGGRDFAYPPDSYAKTYDLVRSPKNIRFVPDMSHGHIFDRPKAIEAFISQHLDNGLPLARISPPEIRDGRVSANVDTKTKLVSAALHYTMNEVSEGPAKRKWVQQPATIEQNVVTSTAPPKAARIWFLTVTDERETTVSSKPIFPASRRHHMPATSPADDAPAAKTQGNPPAPRQSRPPAPGASAKSHLLSVNPTAKCPLKINVDWPEFIGRHDLIWDKLPTHFDYGAFLGNGMLGSTIYQDGSNRLRWEMGRSDVTEHRRDNARLPIGGLVLTTVGKIQNGTMRMDLWNAEVRGTITTDKGAITFRSLIHTHEMVLITDVDSTEGEKDASVAWEARPCIDNRNSTRFKDPPNPPASTGTIRGSTVCTQPRFAGGEFATAWKEAPLDKGRRVIVSIADSFPGKTATGQAVTTIEKAVNTDFETLLKSHRDWWHNFYPKSMVSVPDPKLESFYWIQFYKLASASRPHLVPVDLLGPWYRNTSWPRIWWNLNIQTLYLPVYTGNRLELGESFTNFIDAKRANFYRNAKDIWGFDGCATVSHTSCYEGLRGDGSAAPGSYINPGDFTWALHNYYLHYRYSMDHSMVTDQSRHAFYPLLRDSINLYLNILKKGDDGKLHLPKLHSPEYGDDADNNYNLSLLRWGCLTLIDLNKRYDLKDPLVPTWKKTLDDLVAYPVDDNGLRVGASISYTKSHRHWSHILMVHPLHIMTSDQPENRKLLEKSVLHWLTVDSSRGINGWSRAAAASLYATLGDGDNAIKQIHGHMADQRFVRPNTMYIEGSPVIECSIVLNRSLQDMLLQSWGNKIAVFPAIPKTWDSAVFHDLRAEGAFLVSASRKDGGTVWVRIKSLAGEPCRIQPGLSGTATVALNGKQVEITPSAEGVYKLPLGKGDEAVLYTGELVPDLTVSPLPADPMEINPFGSVRK